MTHRLKAALRPNSRRLPLGRDAETAIVPHRVATRPRRAEPAPSGAEPDPGLVIADREWPARDQARILEAEMVWTEIRRLTGRSPFGES